ncbi:MAG: hypothetical protein H7232_18585 [Aeromicrobium sp.]|nr:hypothetical protein [Burkholderiales bacterium]
MAKVLTVTTSMGTRWEAYSQALLRTFVPEWRRVVVDGRRNWTPTGFIEQVISEDVDYVVHVDEDCFVSSREGLLGLIQHLESDHSISAAGIPDGGSYYRNHNPAALNLYFVVFRASALRFAWQKRAQWRQMFFQQSYAREVLRQRADLDFSRISWDEGEPYYPLFWALLGMGGRFLYLREQLHPTRWSSVVQGADGAIAEHLWYLRQWFSNDTMPGHDRPNRSRYAEFEAELLARPSSSLAFQASVVQGHGRRLWRRVMS